jgi:toxin-antitoxin system PIN domain toxin
VIVIPDVNVLVAAAFELHPFHAVTREWLVGTKRRREHVSLLVETIPGYLRLLTTKPADFTVPEAMVFLDALLAEPNVTFSRPSHVQMAHFREFMMSGRIRGRDSHDAMIAAAALDLDATLVTWDAGFSRFSALRWQRPGDRQPVTNPR